MKHHALKPALTTAAIAALCVLGLAGCAPQGLPYPKPTNATQVNADFTQAAKSGNYDQLNAITESSARTQAISIAKQVHKTLNDSKCTIKVLKPGTGGSSVGWIAVNQTNCSGVPQHHFNVLVNQAGSRIVGVNYEQSFGN